MLSELRITNLGVIADAVAEFAPGLTALTGETGAGKTMIVAGLGQLLGVRADAGVVRHGASRSSVEGRWQVGASGVQAVEELGGEAEDSEVLTVRHITAAGRSRALVGGVQATIGNLSELVGEWATIHGQSEQLRLGTTDRQREVLDSWAKPSALPDYRVAFERYQSLSSEVSSLKSEAMARAREIDVLRFGVADIEAIDPQPGEDAALASEAARLQASDDLRLLALRAQTLLSGGDDAFDEPGALGLVGQGRKAVEQLAAVDATAGGLASRLAEASMALADVAADVSRYVDDLPSDPLRLEAVTQRRAALSGLTRKYGSDVGEVLEWAAAAASRLEQLQGGDTRIGEIEAELLVLDERLDAMVEAIRADRVAAASRLAEGVRGELAALAMPHAKLEFVVTPLMQRNAHGADKVDLLFSANAGASPAPLAKVASGGELSRVRLALEVVLAGASEGHTFVFDEVDAGVGGAVGLEIGRRLKALSARSQVIVVTHLAQVAAFADQHLVVTKSDDGEVTASDVGAVTGDDRVNELARMMAGLGNSAAAREHAEDLLMAAGSPF